VASLRRSVTAVAGLASIYKSDNQLQKARELYLRNTELDPRNPVPQFAVGSVDLAIIADKQGDLLHLQNPGWSKRACNSEFA